MNILLHILLLSRYYLLGTQSFVILLACLWVMWVASAQLIMGEDKLLSTKIQFICAMMHGGMNWCHEMMSVFLYRAHYICSYAGSIFNQGLISMPLVNYGWVYKIPHTLPDMLRAGVCGGGRGISCRELGTGDHQGWLYRRSRASSSFLHTYNWDRRWFILKVGDVHTCVRVHCRTVGLHWASLLLIWLTLIIGYIFYSLFLIDILYKGREACAFKWTLRDRWSLGELYFFL